MMPAVERRGEEKGERRGEERGEEKGERRGERRESGLNGMGITQLATSSKGLTVGSSLEGSPSLSWWCCRLVPMLDVAKLVSVPCHCHLKQT